MRAAVGRPKPSRRNMGVDLGGGEAFVAEQLLDHAEIGPALEQVRRERMAERVRRDAEGEAGALPEQLEAIPEPADAEWRTEMVQKDRRRLIVGRPTVRGVFCGGRRAARSTGPPAA